MPRFKGIPIENSSELGPTRSRFGGIPIDEEYQTPVVQTQPEQTPYEKSGVMGAIFPGTTAADERGGSRISGDIGFVGDVLSLPARGVSALSTGLGYLHGGGTLKEAGKEALKDLGRTKGTAKGALGIAQDVALDPTSSPMLLGLGTAAKGAKGATTLGKALAKTALAGAASGAGSAAYQSVADDGEIDPGRVATQAAIGAGTGAAMTGLGAAAKKATGKFLQDAAKKNVDIIMRPGKTGAKKGFSHDAVIKYDLGGSPREIYENATLKLKDLQAQAKAVAKSNSSSFDLEEIFTNAMNKLKRTASPEDFDKQVTLLNGIYDDYYKAFGDIVDAPTAMEVRTRIGEKSNFVGRTQGGMKADPDADWKEKVYNNIYHELKDQLHNKLGGDLQAINKAQSEIIPVKQVAEGRIPIYESHERIGLGDLLTSRFGQTMGGAAFGGTAGYGASGGDFESALKGAAVGAGLAGARKYLGGPQATKAMYRIGDYLLK